MSDTQDFQKYKKRGAYHWDQISMHPIKRSAFVLARYKNIITILKQERLLESKKVLDLGCGDGVMSMFLAQHANLVEGLDYSPEALAFAKDKTKQFSNLTFSEGSAYELPYPDNTFDVVVSTEVIEHLDDVDAYISEIKRVTKNNGSALITTPIRLTQEPLDPEHVVEWFPEEYQKLINKAFGESRHITSHPLAWTELNLKMLFGKPFPKVLINILSYVANPFEGTSSSWRLSTIQYSLSVVKK